MNSDKVDFKNRKHIHFTGIKGVGQTALAICAKDLGIKVSGSDTEELFVTDNTLDEAGIEWKRGFGANNLADDVDLLVTTVAHAGFENPEVVEAKKRGIDVTTYAHAMSDLANSKKVITVVGVGGKTTTTSILATMFISMSLNPSYIVGVGSIDPIGLPGHYDGEGEYFICEGDDYVVMPGHDNRAKFLLLNPQIVVVTNIEHDHPDIYKDINSTLAAFKKLFSKIPENGLLIANIDNANVVKAIAGISCKICTYGFSKKADYVITEVKVHNGSSKFSINHKNKKTKIEIQVPGNFNILNITASFIVGDQLGIDIQSIKKGLRYYKGCKRRFEKVGVFNGAQIYDDYAHHPEEIKSVLSAARKWYKDKRIVTLFQPHTYSRTKALFDEFGDSFKDADIVGIMDIYTSARESVDKTVSSKKLAESVSEKGKESYYTKGHASTISWIKRTVEKGDLLITIGAGDIFHLHKKLT